MCSLSLLFGHEFFRYNGTLYNCVTKPLRILLLYYRLSVSNLNSSSKFSYLWKKSRRGGNLAFKTTWPLGLMILYRVTNRVSSTGFDYYYYRYRLYTPRWWHTVPDTIHAVYVTWKSLDVLMGTCWSPNNFTALQWRVCSQDTNIPLSSFLLEFPLTTEWHCENLQCKPWNTDLLYPKSLLKNRWTIFQNLFLNLVSLRPPQLCLTR